MSITRLVDCVSKHLGMGENFQGDSATDVLGQKPSVFDLGRVRDPTEVKNVLKIIEDMLVEEGRQDIALIHDSGLSGRWKEAMQSQIWEVANVLDYTGWERDTVVYVGRGNMEAITRGRERLVMVLLWGGGGRKYDYDSYHAAIQTAATEGLVDLQTVRRGGGV